MSSKAFLDLVKARRSYYNILPRSLIEPSAIKNIIDQAVLHTPSTYNTQGGRVVLLLGEAHRQAWSVVREHTMAWLQGNEEMIKMHSAKIDGYANGYGTVMFLEDEETIEASYKRSPQFRDLGLFDKWAQDSNAMMQFVVWTALEAEGFGASLQHHTVLMPALTLDLHKTFNIPSTWKFTAMMPFGVPVGEPGQPGAPAKTFMPIDDRVMMLSNVPSIKHSDGVAATNVSVLTKDPIKEKA